jgi:hypothetical protein
MYGPCDLTFSSAEKVSLDSPTDIVVDTAQSEKISLDSPTDIVVDTAVYIEVWVFLCDNCHRPLYI